MQVEILDIRNSKATGVMHALHRSVVMNPELSKKAKLAVVRSIFVPILIYGYESWLAFEMTFLRRIKAVTLLDKVCNSEIHHSVNVELLLFRIERSQRRWFGHVSRISQDRLPKQALSAIPNGKRPVGRPRRRRLNHIEDFRRTALNNKMKELMEDLEMQYVDCITGTATTATRTGKRELEERH